MTDPVDAALARSATPSTALTVVLAFDRPIDVGWLGDEPSRRRHWSPASGLSHSLSVLDTEGNQWSFGSYADE